MLEFVCVVGWGKKVLAASSCSSAIVTSVLCITLGVPVRVLSCPEMALNVDQSLRRPVPWVKDEQCSLQRSR